jgi:predicted nucleic acid-binding protein
VATTVVTDYVVDASAVIDALAAKDGVGIALRARIGEATCHAPHLVDAEVGQVLRHSVRRGELDDEEARTGLRALTNMIDHRYPHTGALSSKAWELRDVVTFYNGLYVALAARLDLPLLTTDATLTRAPGLPCRIELVG